MGSRCPICFQNISETILEAHVNTCLDSLESGESLSQSQETGKCDNAGNNDGKKLSKNAFAALGLRVDSTDKKKSFESKKVSKDSPTLTSLLIAEKRLKELTRSNSEMHVLQRSQPIINIKREPEADHSFKLNEHKVNKSSIGDSSRLMQSDSTQNVNETGNSSNEDEKGIMFLRKHSTVPLAQRVRPKELDDFHGQEHLLGDSGILRNIIHSSSIPSFILWGPPGVGKTSLARITAKSANYRFLELSGSEANVKKLKDAFANAENEKRLTGRKTILFLDEIHRFNKANQDLLLPFIEKGVLTVIGATTENPSFSLNNALLSRMHTFIMHPLSSAALIRIISKGLYLINRTRKYVYGLHSIALKKDAARYVADLSSGDSRTALNFIETIHAYLSNSNFVHHEGTSRGPSNRSGAIVVSADDLKTLLGSQKFVSMYDKQGDMHYDTISAFHKSIRGSNADAAIFYLTKMLQGGEDPLFIVRRMIVMASEDIGLRDSSCLPFIVAAKEALEFIGMPEGEIVLAHCTIKLARAPKSTKSYRALKTAQSLLNEKPELNALAIPIHLRNAPTKLMKELGYGKEYKYNPEFRLGKVKQRYFPEGLEDTRFIEDTHLGTKEDEEVDIEIMKKAVEEDNEYLKFKKMKREILKEEFKKQKLKDKIILSKSKKEAAEKRLLSRLRLRTKILNLLKSDPQLVRSLIMNDLSQTKTNALKQKSGTSPRPSYPYDEFLSREDQPQYFDGYEKDEYSDDPDCTHNFEMSYDENNPDNESDHSVQLNSEEHYSPEYPVPI